MAVGRMTEVAGLEDSLRLGDGDFFDHSEVRDFPPFFDARPDDGVLAVPIPVRISSGVRLRLLGRPVIR